MSMALQIALILASIAVVVLVAFLIPFVLHLRKQSETAVRQLEELNSEVKLLMKDSHSMIADVHALSTRAHQQLDELEKMLRRVGAWSERVDRIVQEIGTAIEPPLLTAARNITIFRRGLMIFLEKFLHRNHTEQKDEAVHGRE